MRYVIMADGKGSRWNNFMGHKKHDISVSGETLLERTVRLVHKFDDAAEIIITSHDESISIPGAVRYEPKNNVLEIDRFTAELIGDDMCFLYGDVRYIAPRRKAAAVFRQRKEHMRRPRRRRGAFPLALPRGAPPLS